MLNRNNPDISAKELKDELLAEMAVIKEKIDGTVEAVNMYRAQMAKIDAERDALMNAISEVELEQNELNGDYQEYEATLKFIDSRITPPEPMTPLEPSTPIVPMEPLEPSTPGEIPMTPIEENPTQPIDPWDDPEFIQEGN